jgi:hypothetical protein
MASRKNFPGITASKRNPGSPAIGLAGPVNGLTPWGQPDRYEMFVNLKTAKVLGLTILVLVGNLIRLAILTGSGSFRLKIRRSAQHK